MVGATKQVKNVVKCHGWFTPDRPESDPIRRKSISKQKEESL